MHSWSIEHIPRLARLRTDQVCQIHSWSIEHIPKLARLRTDQVCQMHSWSITDHITKLGNTKVYILGVKT